MRSTAGVALALALAAPAFYSPPAGGPSFLSFARAADPATWDQGYLAEYFHQCEPGSFVDTADDDPNVLPEKTVVATELNFVFTDSAGGCADWRGTQGCGLEGGFPGVGIPDQFAAKYTGFVTIPTSGDYDFCLDSDDGSKLWIAGAEIVDDNGVHGLGWPQCGTVEGLKKGQKVTVKVKYFENDGLAGLRFYWKVPGAGGDPVIVPASALSHRAHAGGGGASGETDEPGLLGEYYRDCHAHENLESLGLQLKQPVFRTVVKKREINYQYCHDYWCPDYVAPDNDKSNDRWWERDVCQEDPTTHDSCVPYRDYFAMRLTGYLNLNGFKDGEDSMNCTFRLTSSDGAAFYLGGGEGPTGLRPLVDHDGLHSWFDDRSQEASIVITSDDIAVGRNGKPAGKWPGGYIPFRLEYFNNDGYHALILEMQGCHDEVTYAEFAPLRLTEFVLPSDTDANATNPPDRQCKRCATPEAMADPTSVDGGCYPERKNTSFPEVERAVVEAGRKACLDAGKLLWCDQVRFPTQVGDGRCDVDNNVPGCWDGGDCCPDTCRDGPKYMCPLAEQKDPPPYPHCVHMLKPGLDAELFQDVSIGDVGELIERTEVPSVWWPDDVGPMQYLNGSGVVKEWEHFYLRLSGFLYIPDSGQYTFYLAADDGGTLYIDGERQLDDTGVHGMVTEQRPTWLSAGYHQIQVNMQQKLGNRGLELSIRGPSYLDPELYKKQPVRTEWLWNGNPCGDESGFGVDVPLDVRDLKVPRSPLCASHGVCEADCPKSHEHGSCYRHTCVCDNGYKVSILYCILCIVISV